jgi:quinol-cytochrome oxidoreductase complex cytochrome b subunit
LDARQAWWLWVNLLALILLVQIAAGMALMLAGAPAEIVTAHRQQVTAAAQAVPWILIGVGFAMGAYGRPFRWVWVTLAALAVLSVVFGFSGYVVPWGQMSYLLAAQGVPVTLNHVALVLPVAVFVDRAGRGPGSGCFAGLGDVGDLCADLGTGADGGRK